MMATGRKLPAQKPSKHHTTTVRKIVEGVAAKRQRAMSDDGKSQAEKSKEAAQKAGCDTGEEAFEDRLRKVATSVPRSKSESDQTPPGKGEKK
jgi:hypothetical protein